MNLKKHDEKVIIVTGGAQGLGASIVETMYKQGAHIIIADLQAEKSELLINKLKNNNNESNNNNNELLFIESDIATQEGCKNVINFVSERFDCLDGIVNNAAPSRNIDYVGRLSDANWKDHGDLVLQAVVCLTEYAESYLKKAKSASVVNISSVTARRVGLDGCSWPYHVSKAGLEQLTRYLACRLGADNIRVNAVAPGLIDRNEGMKISEIPGNSKIIDSIVPLKRAASAEEIANVVSFLISNESSYITGEVITVDGGLELLEGMSAALKLYD